jgi:hypothetical protein
MPVRAAFQDGVLAITVDGEYTPEELRGTGDAALLDPGVAGQVRVLLDVTDAVGLRARSSETLRETALFFAARRDRVAKVAILAPDDLGYGLMRQAAVYAGNAGLVAQVFRTRAEGLSWLAR